MRRTRAVQFATAAVALALLLPACSSNRASTADTPAGSASTTASSANNSFGTLASPCGKGDAKGTTEQGVTDSSITIGYGDDRGYPASPGLSAEMGDAVKAMIGWCNEQGGINGRKIVGNQYDAAITKVNTVMQQACKSDFMLVGEGFAGDSGGEAARVGCNLVAVPGFTIGPDVLNGPMSYSSFPRPVDFFNNLEFTHAVELDPAAKTGLEIVSTTLPAIQTANVLLGEAAKAAGLTPKNCGITTNAAGEPNYVPFAEKYKTCDIKAAFYAGSGTPPIFNLVQSIDQVGLHPTFVFGSSFYADAVAQWNAKTKIDKLYVDMSHQPFENASLVPAVQKYLDILKPTGGKTALLGMQATSSFLLWATAAKSCGSDLTRQCMVNALSKVHDWTGGGLHAATDPGNNMPTKCSMTVQLQDGKFSQVIPKTQAQLDCSDSSVVPMPSSAWGTALGPDRIATKFLTANVIKPKV